VATAPGYRRWEGRVTVQGEAATQTFEIPALEKAPDEPVGTPPPPVVPVVGKPVDVPAEAPRDGTGQRIGGFVVIGAGAVGVIAGAVFGAKALSQKKKSDELCNGDSKETVCPALPAGTDVSGGDAATLNDSAAKNAKIANGLIFGGIGVAVVGTVLVLTAPRAKPAATTGTSAWLAPAFGPSSGGLTVGGRF
jgi:hypothetical protein